MSVKEIYKIIHLNWHKAPERSHYLSIRLLAWWQDAAVIRLTPSSGRRREVTHNLYHKVWDLKKKAIN